mmetsp:Transcript_20693/g.44937  ORF Transcript_20693/g.44937 Transcript_20693/m.44937 type:complete len:150 (-) Transcript_20693:3-452(-)
MCFTERSGTDEVRPEEVKILRFFFPSLPMMAPRLICLLAPVPELNSTRRPSLRTSSLLVSLVAANNVDDGGTERGHDVKPMPYSIDAAMMASTSARLLGVMIPPTERAYLCCCDVLMMWFALIEIETGEIDDWDDEVYVVVHVVQCGVW